MTRLHWLKCLQKSAVSWWVSSCFARWSLRSILCVFTDFCILNMTKCIYTPETAIFYRVKRRYRLTHLLLRWRPAWHPCWRCNRAPYWRWRFCGNASCLCLASVGFLLIWPPAGAWVWVRCESHLLCCLSRCRPYADGCCTRLWMSEKRK